MLALKITLNGVNRAVVHKGVLKAVHLHVRGYKAAAGAVVVNSKVVRIENVGIGENALAHRLHVLGVGCAAQQRANGRSHQLGARYRNKNAHSHASPDIQIKACDVLNNGADKDDDRGNNVVSRVLRRSKQRLGINKAAKLAVKGKHPQFYNRGANKYGNQRGRKVCGVGVNKFIVRLFDEVHTQG